TLGAYSVAENAHPGYDVTFSAECSGTIGSGETKTCTVTNDDQTAHLKLVKTVTNDNGGTAAATAWTLSASGPTPISGPGGAESDANPRRRTLAVTLGAYSEAEDAHP